MGRAIIPLIAVLLLYAGYDALGAFLLLAVGLFWLSFGLTAIHMTWQDWTDTP
jgi:succinate-acetate transporter protein